MTPTQIAALSKDEVLALMRKVGLPVEHSLFCTIHLRGPDREDGYSDADLEEISDDLEGTDLQRWRRELAEHFSGKG